MTTLLMIDESVLDQNIITGSLRENVIVVTEQDLSNLDNFGDIARLGLMFENIENSEHIPFFEGATDKNMKYYSNNLLQCIRNIQSHNTDKSVKLVLDIISCNMNSNNFKEETTTVCNKLNITVGYSVNQTGNGHNSDWVLENNNENLLDTYFTETILQWNHTLNTTRLILSSDNLAPIITAFGGNAFIKYSDKHRKYELLQNATVTITSTPRPHIQLNEGEVFDGKGYTLTLATNISSGLFIINSNQHNKSRKTTIKNLTIAGTSIYTNGGGLVTNYQSGFTVENCTNKRFFNNNCGGICGIYCNNFTIKKCTNTSNLDVDNGAAGGMCGPRCYNFNIKECKNMSDLGVINNSSAGICGIFCTKFKIEKCTNNFTLNDDYAAGICAPGCSDFKIISCINNGNINNFDQCGGIVSSNCANFEVYKCINNGNLVGSQTCGGIIASLCINFKATKCTNNGNMQINSNAQNLPLNCGGISGGSSSNCEINKCVNKGVVFGKGCGGIIGANGGLYSGEITQIPANNYIKIINCKNYGNISGQEDGQNSGYACGGIAGQSFGIISNSFYNMKNLTCEIKNCINKGTIIQNASNTIESTGICAANLGYVDKTNGSYSKITIEDCYTKYGNVLGKNTLFNDTISNQDRLTDNVWTELIMKNTSTHANVPLVLGFAAAQNLVGVSATYIKENGKKVNLLKNPTYKNID